MPTDTPALHSATQIADALRPNDFEDFIGQARIKENLSIMIGAANLRNEILGDLLICGPAGTGKVALGLLVANAVGVTPVTRHARELKEPDELARILSNMQRGGVLIIEDIDQLGPPLQAMLCGVVEDDNLDVQLGHGPSARSLRLTLPPFTVIGISDASGSIPMRVSSRLRERFDETIHLAPYTTKEVEAIVFRASQILGIEIEQDGAELIAQNSGGIPRDSIRLLNRILDYAQVRGDGRITLAITRKALAPG